MTRVVCRTIRSGCVGVAVSLAASSAFAGPVVMSGSYASGTYTATDSTTNLSSLDHHSLYTWQIEGLQGLTSGQVVTAASLTFNNFSNWTTFLTEEAE